MNWDIFEGNWSQVKGSIMQKWGKLTDDELEQAKGQREELLGLIQERYGLAKAEAEEEMNRLIADIKSVA